MPKRIVCIEEEVKVTPHDTTHIVRVGIGQENGDPDFYEDIDTVRSNLAGPGVYYARVDGVEAEVESATCDTCEFETIRAAPEETTSNTLERLPSC